MSQQPVARPAYTRPAIYGANRLLFFVGGVCMLISSLVAAGIFNIGPWIAWALGAVAAWFFSYVF
jgi:hypothetical protein